MCLLCSWSVPVWNVCIITPLTEIDASPNHLHMQQSSTWMNLIADKAGGEKKHTFKKLENTRNDLILDVQKHMFGRRRRKKKTSFVMDVWDCSQTPSAKVSGMSDLLRRRAWPCFVGLQQEQWKATEWCNFKNYLWVGNHQSDAQDLGLQK